MEGGQYVQDYLVMRENLEHASNELHSGRQRVDAAEREVERSHGEKAMLGQKLEFLTEQYNQLKSDYDQKAAEVANCVVCSNKLGHHPLCVICLLYGCRSGAWVKSECGWGPFAKAVDWNTVHCDTSTCRGNWRS